MKDKIKKIFKNRILIFGLGILISGSVSVLAVTYFPSDDVTYDNKTSGLKSTNVQGAIDELYSTCNASSTSSDLKENVVTSGDGLYKDEYEDGRYFYKGANPNNYIVFDVGIWRIISIESDGTIKIIKKESVAVKAWNSSSSNDWSSASLNTYLNKDYYNSLTSTAQSYIVSHNFSVGAVIEENDDLVSQIADENSTIWNGNVGLVTVSELLRTNSNKSLCETISLNYTNSAICKNTNWLIPSQKDLGGSSNFWWTITPSTSRYYAFYSNLIGSAYGIHVSYASYPIRPVVYLKSGLKLSGSGTSSDSYTIR